MIARFLARLLERFTAPQEAPALPRYEIRKSDDGFVFWLLDHKTARKYPFAGETHVRSALEMVKRGGAPFLLHVPFTRNDYRKAR